MRQNLGQSDIYVRFYSYFLNKCQKKSDDECQMASDCPSDTYKISPNKLADLVSEFSLRYFLIFEDQILVLDFSSRYWKKNSQKHF